MIPATKDHALYIAEHLREGDVDELRALHPEEALEDIVLSSFLGSAPLCFTGIWDGLPVCIFGVAPSQTEGSGIVWMLGTDGIFAAAQYLRLFTGAWVEWMNSIYPVIANECAVANTVSIAWLQASGFEFGEAYDVNGSDFISFWRTQNV